MQDNFVILNDTYREVEELYMDDGIAQDDDIEELLNEAKSLIDEMGELSEDDFESQQDLVDMNESMVDILEAKMIYRMYYYSPKNSYEK